MARTSDRARHAGLCARMMENIERHVISPTTREKAGLWCGFSNEYAEEIPRGHGCTKEELRADIRHLRRELLELYRMI